MAESSSDSPEVVREQSESVAASNLSVIGSSTAYYGAILKSNAVTQQQQMAAISQAVASKAAQMVLESNIPHAGTEIAALQQLMKGAQSTPPVTG